MYTLSTISQKLFVLFLYILCACNFVARENVIYTYTIAVVVFCL